jgi:hypothetical protein
MTACESLTTATFVNLSGCSVSCYFTNSRSASLIANSTQLKTSSRLVPRWLRNALKLSLCLHTATAPTVLSSDHDPSIHHIQTPTPTFASLSVAQHTTSLFAGVSSRPLPTATSLGRNLPDFSGRQEVHHRLVALFYGKQLRYLHMSASARFPARRLCHRLP